VVAFKFLNFVGVGMRFPITALQRGQKVFIRALTAEDGPEWIRLNRASRELHKGWVSPLTTPAQFKEYLIDDKAEDKLTLLVCLQSDSAIVGSVGLSQIFYGSFCSCYMGYAVGAPYAKQGYMTEGLQLVLKHAFSKLKLHRVEANIQPENTASIALVKRAGFQLEGYSPRYLKIAGRWCDHERWAMVKEHFRN
jgi:[ribosomal protein S5]-alanine N-acetyltransferase